MIVRQTQMQTLQDAGEQNFLNTVAAEIRTSFPKHCAAMQPGDVERKVQIGFDTARKQGFQTANGLRLFAELGFLFGTGFIKDPLLPWVPGALKTGGSELSRVEQLRTQAMAYLEAVAGPSGEHMQAAMGRVRAEPLDNFPAASAPEFAPQAARRLSAIYPQRFQAAGVDGMRAMMDAGQKAANIHGLVSGSGVALYLALMFFLGSEFDQDPQFTSLAALLSGPGSADQKQADLYRAALGLLQ
jgi:hypothetical protein